MDGGRMGELDKASLGDRGTLWSEFNSPGEHSCSHIRALPLHTQLHLFLPCQGHKSFDKGGQKCWYFHRSLPHNYTLQHLHRSRHRRLINNRLQQSPVRKVLNRRPELLQVQYSTHYLPNQTKLKGSFRGSHS